MFVLVGGKGWVLLKGHVGFVRASHCYQLHTRGSGGVGCWCFVSSRAGPPEPGSKWRLPGAHLFGPYHSLV